MSKTAYEKTALTGGTATSLDGIDGSSLSDGDFAYVMENGQSYIYVLDADLNLATSSPKYIRPVTNYGTKTWVLQNTLPDKPLTNLLTNSQFIAMSGSTLENVGSNLVTNGGFDSDTTGWTVGNGTGTSVAGGTSGNCIELTPSGGSSAYATQVITTVVGKLYKVIAYYKNGTSSSLRLYIGTTSNGSDIHSSGLIGNASWTTYSIVFEATATTTYITVQNAGSAGTTGYWDTISNYEVTPGYVAANALAPDKWEKSATLDIYREYGSAYVKGLYGVKVVKGDNAEEALVWPGASGVNEQEAFLKLFRGRTVTLGAWIYAVDANNAALTIYDNGTGGGGGFNVSSYAPAGVLTWVELTHTFSADATSIMIGKYLNGDSGQVSYFSQPMLIFGSSIGAGNYQPSSNELILLQSPVSVTAFDGITGFSDVSATVLNVEAQSNGAIGKGVKSLLVKVQTNDSGSAGTDCSMSLGISSSNYTAIISPAGVANDAKVRNQVDIACDANGDFTYAIDATGSGTFDIPLFKIVGVRTN